jgi:c-di-GMP-binding flagellar brake protein YcgR
MFETQPMETQPLPLSALRDVEKQQALDDFRVHTQAEILALLRQLMDGQILVTITTPLGTTYTTTVWTIDAGRGTLSFSADARDSRMNLLLDADEAIAVGYLDNVKVQFDVNALVLVRGQNGSVLNCEFPQDLYRIQRRESFRVRPLTTQSPCVHFIPPRRPEAPLTLRVLDVSLGGAALHLPAQTPAVEPGDVLENVEMRLDADTKLHVSLAVHHITVISREDNGSRLGCSFTKLSNDDLMILRRYIDQTQKRQRLMMFKL